VGGGGAEIAEAANSPILLLEHRHASSEMVLLASMLNKTELC
jgi:hypothetical protein